MRTCKLALLALSIVYTTASLHPSHSPTHLELPNLPSNTTPLLTPSAPPGFHVLIGLDTTHPLDPQKIYLSAISVLHDWAFLGWNHILPPTAHPQSKVTHGITTTWTSLAASTRQGRQLQVKELVFGMLHLIDQMAKQARFCQAYASVTMFGVGVGHIEVIVPGRGKGGRKTPISEAEEDEEDRGGRNIVATKSKNDTTPNNNNTLRVPHTHKKILDPQDHNFALIYTPRGPPVSPANFLTTVLYAMATAAQAPNDQVCVDFAGFNDKRSMMWRVRGIRTRESRYGFTYEDVRKGLRLLAEAVYEDGEVGEVAFEVRYRGELFGLGEIRRNDFWEGGGV